VRLLGHRRRPPGARTNLLSGADAPHRPRGPRPRRRRIRAQSGAFFGALTHIDASLAALLLYTYPAVVFGIAIALGRERADRPRVIASASPRRAPPSYWPAAGRARSTRWA
jgi:hypothetical protein